MQSALRSFIEMLSLERLTCDEVGNFWLLDFWHCRCISILMLLIPYGYGTPFWKNDLGVRTSQQCRNFSPI